MATLEDLESDHSRIQEELARPEVYRDGHEVRFRKQMLENNERRQTRSGARWKEVETELAEIRDELRGE